MDASSLLCQSFLITKPKGKVLTNDSIPGTTRHCGLPAALGTLQIPRLRFVPWGEKKCLYFGKASRLRQPGV